jgi:hypothetical protein
MPFKREFGSGGGAYVSEHLGDAIQEIIDLARK